MRVGVSVFVGVRVAVGVSVRVEVTVGVKVGETVAVHAAARVGKSVGGTVAVKMAVAVEVGAEPHPPTRRESGFEFGDAVGGLAVPRRGPRHARRGRVRRADGHRGLGRRGEA